MKAWPTFDWRPLSPKVEHRLSEVLELWRGTPYCVNGQTPRVSVDCVRFVCAIADRMERRQPLAVPRVPADQSLHAPESARAAMRLLMRRYGARRVVDGSLEPGDVLATGPEAGGPGHAIIVGTRPTEMWQATPPNVWPTAYGPQEGAELFYGVLRVPKENWI